VIGACWHLELVLLVFEAREGKGLISAAQIGVIIFAGVDIGSNSLDISYRA
jgi:hypothetical protein